MNVIAERVRSGRLRFVLAALVIALMLAGGAWTLRAQDAAGVVARVNGEVITKDELFDAMYEYIGPQVLDEMIIIRLTQQEAARRGIGVTDADIEAELDAWAVQVGGRANLELLLMQQGMTVEQLAEQLRINLTIRALIASEIVVTDEEVRQVFDANPAQFARQEMVRARHILVDTREQAEALRAQILDGADFAQLAREHSTDPGSGPNGGDLGWFGRGVMVAPFEEAAFALPVGRVSEPVETAFGFHLILVEERQEAEEPAFTDEVAELIRTALVDQKVEQRWGPWLQALRTGADVEIYIGD
ncbi:MAG: peptidylprolyl isomerase [Limnochordales bacterium]|nr:MAG: peptidylprolyl isomerase [Bacillota bacterium]